jgi:hypothetical protein
VRLVLASYRHHYHRRGASDGHCRLPVGFCCCWLLLLAEYHSDAIQINPSHES